MNEARRVTVRRSAEEWRTIMSRFERSGGTIKQFCTAEQLAPSAHPLSHTRIEVLQQENARG